MSDKPTHTSSIPLIGTPGEHQAQTQFGTIQRASAFYRQQMCAELNDVMATFIKEQEFVFIATADARGAADSSFRAGLPGFIHILTPQKLAFPEFRGNGVMASVGNILENPQIGMMFIDFFEHKIGLHVNGRATVMDNANLMNEPGVTEALRQDAVEEGGRHPECWIVVDVEEAYIHCSKHIPMLEKKKKPVDWGTDDEHAKRGSFFQSRRGS